MRTTELVPLVTGGAGLLAGLSGWVSAWMFRSQLQGEIARLEADLETAKKNQELAVYKQSSEASKLRAEVDAAGEGVQRALKDIEARVDQNRLKAQRDETVGQALTDLLREPDHTKRSFSVIKKHVPLDDEALRSALLRIGARQFWTKGEQPEELWGLAERNAR